MSTPWAYTDSSNQVVTYTDANGVSYSELVTAQDVQAWIAAGNTPAPYVAPTLTAEQQASATYNAAMTAGVVLTWSTSTSLNGTYAVNSSAQFNISAETDSILLNGNFANGTASTEWPNSSGAMVSFNVAQFKAFATVVAKYVNALISTLQSASAGRSVTWPSANISIGA